MHIRGNTLKLKAQALDIKKVDTSFAACHLELSHDIIVDTHWFMPITPESTEMLQTRRLRQVTLHRHHEHASKKLQIKAGSIGNEFNHAIFNKKYFIAKIYIIIFIQLAHKNND